MTTMRQTADEATWIKARADYEREGYAHLRHVLPAELLDRCRGMIDKWVDYKARQWYAEGRITDLREDLDHRRRFHVLWQAAGRPHYNRSPRAEIMRLDPPTMFAILSHPALTGIAAAILQSEEIVTHSVWNSRPKAPQATFTDTPWHQDAQYFTDQAAIHTMTLWFPLHDVDSEGSCLAVAPGCHRMALEAGVESDSAFIGIDPVKAESLPQRDIPMQAGDALVFPQRMPHRATSNRSPLMRWSMDMRFVRAEDAVENALKLGHVSRSSDASKLTSFEQWLAKWKDAPAW